MSSTPRQRMKTLRRMPAPPRARVIRARSALRAAPVACGTGTIFVTRRVPTPGREQRGLHLRPWQRATTLLTSRRSPHAPSLRHARCLRRLWQRRPQRRQPQCLWLRLHPPPRAQLMPAITQRPLLRPLHRRVGKKQRPRPSLTRTSTCRIPKVLTAPTSPNETNAPVFSPRPAEVRSSLLRAAARRRRYQSPRPLCRDGLL